MAIARSIALRVVACPSEGTEAGIGAESTDLALDAALDLDARLLRKPRRTKLVTARCAPERAKELLEVK